MLSYNHLIKIFGSSHRVLHQSVISLSVFTCSQHTGPIPPLFKPSLSSIPSLNQHENSQNNWQREIGLQEWDLREKIIFCWATAWKALKKSNKTLKEASDKTIKKCINFFKMRKWKAEVIRCNVQTCQPWFLTESDFNQGWQYFRKPEGNTP